MTLNLFQRLDNRNWEEKFINVFWILIIMKLHRYTEYNRYKYKCWTVVKNRIIIRKHFEWLSPKISNRLLAIFFRSERLYFNYNLIFLLINLHNREYSIAPLQDEQAKNNLRREHIIDGLLEDVWKELASKILNIVEKLLKTGGWWQRYAKSLSKL